MQSSRFSILDRAEIDDEMSHVNKYVGMRMRVLTGLSVVVGLRRLNAPNRAVQVDENKAEREEKIPGELNFGPGDSMIVLINVLNEPKNPSVLMLRGG